MKKLKTVAIDFDGTIVEHRFPKVGDLKMNVVKKIKAWYEKGHTIIIWTCRTDKYADEAKAFLDKNNIPYHFFNENPSSRIKSRKVLADIYLDDRALNVDDINSFNIDSLSFEEDEILQDISLLVHKIEELSLHSVMPNLSDIEAIKRKYL